MDRTDWILQAMETSARLSIYADRLERDAIASIESDPSYSADCSHKWRIVQTVRLTLRKTYE